MRLLRQQGPYCLLYSAAMVLDTDPDCLIEEIGHNGSEPVGLGDGYYTECNFTFTEINACCTRRGYCLAQLDAEYVMSYGMVSRVVRQHLPDLLPLGSGILALSPLRGGHAHAAAWDGKLVYNPAVGLQTLDQITQSHSLDSFWLLCRLPNQKG